MRPTAFGRLGRLDEAPTDLRSTAGRWYGVLTFTIVVAISYVDRVNISVLITDDAFLDRFGLAGDRVAQGALMTIFLLGYGLAAFVLTPVYETLLGVRRGLVVSVAIWAVLTFVSPWIGSLFLLLTVRCLLGAAEGPLFSLKTMYVKDRFADAELGRPNAVSSMGVSLGTAVGMPLITLLIVHSDWATSFHALGALNALLGIPLVLLFIRPLSAGNRGSDRDHAQDRVADQKPEGGPIPSDRHPRSFGILLPTLVRALRTPRLGWILLIEIATLAFLWGTASWLPSYLLQARHFSAAQTGWLAALPFTVSLGSGLLGGLVIDRVPQRHLPLVLVVGSVGAGACATLAVSATSATVSATALILAGGFWGLQGPAIPTLVQRHASAGSVGSAYGVVNGVGNLVSAFMPTLMGTAIAMDSGHGFAAGLSLLVVTQLITLVSAVVLLLRHRGPHAGQGRPLPSTGPAVQSAGQATSTAL
ncbi:MULTISPECIES: MFS transporter [unclassified Streptomyces]|uniref:MFS transporter n=1 Tax=unclassified Streptomyces TaxID=2593676 RepID=UPI002DDA7143|nr:MFS transporter [Streptomyces sp. NBC_01762]WSC49744.1 MFS transporter [Streptomyces sp. NBC_01762]WSF82349.1 MFS transporter [Streptomyces sp. NBC_01744]